MQFDPEVFGQLMADAVRKAVAPLKAEIDDLRKQLSERPDIKDEVAAAVDAAVKAIPAPKDGKDADIEDIRRAVSEEVAKIPAPQNGKDADMDEVRGMVDVAVKEAVSALPAPEPGKSFTLEDATPIINKAVELICEDAEKAISEAVKAIPVPENGEDGKSVTVEDVAPMIQDEVQKAVAAIPVPENGKDGAGLAGAMIDRDNCLLITLTNGEVKNLGMVVGRDGVSLESFELEYIADTHEVCIKAAANGQTKEVRYPAGGVHHKGYWRDGMKSKAGEIWTHQGTSWIAMKDTEARPGEDREVWVIHAQKGKDAETIIKRVKDGPAPPVRLNGLKVEE